MRALDIEFAPRSEWRRKVAGAAVVTGCIAVIAASAFAWVQLQASRAAETELEVTRTKVAQQEALQLEREAQAAIAKPYAEDAAEIVRIASFPIDQVLHALEATLIQGVRITTLEINTAAAIVKVELEFGDQTQLMRYMEQINTGAEKPRWALVQAKMTRSANGGGQALLTSTWR